LIFSDFFLWIFFDFFLIFLWIFLIFFLIFDVYLF